MSIEHRLAIHDLVGAYGDAVTRRDDARWQSLWTKDAQWKLGDTIVNGRDAIYDLWRGAMSGFPFAMHVAFPIAVRVDGQHATGRWTVQEILKDTGGGIASVFGNYEDRYERTASGWQFSYRRFELLARVPLPAEGALLLPFPKDLNHPF
jgi:hypothetical protein